MKIGRNQLCPCGSGKKYKHCCITSAGVVLDEISELLSGQDFESTEQMQQMTDAFVAQQNLAPVDDFLGLSSDQVFQMINYPFDSPEMFTFSKQLSIETQAPILLLIKGIASAIDDKGLKATATKGNLPRKLCQQLWSHYCQNYPDYVYFPDRSISNEEEFMELHVARIVMQLSGLLRKTKGRFHLTHKYKKLVKKSETKSLFPIVFRAYCQEFNWGYWDRFDEAPFIQQSFLFSLHLLMQRGNKMIKTTAYENNFMRAFPVILKDFDESSYSTVEKDFRTCYRYRAIQRFLVFLGLAEMQQTPGDKPYETNYFIMKKPLLDEIIDFPCYDEKKR